MGNLKKKQAAKKSKKTTKSRKEKDTPLHLQLKYATDYFLSDLDCIMEMYETVVPVLEEKDKLRNRRIEEIMDSLKNWRSQNERPQKAELPKLMVEINELVDNVRKLDRANDLFRQNALVMVISRYDQFVAATFQNIFQATPDRLKSPDKTLSYEEILQLGSVTNAVDKFISKEIDSLLRESHAEHVNYIDKQMKIGLRESIKCWPTFIEITERRNLFVHTGGSVSQQYIRTCKSNGVILDEKLKEGALLDVSEDYLREAYKCLLEVSVKISQLVSRKLWPKEIETIDTALNDIGLEFLIREKWDLANIVFDFALSLPPKFISDDAQYKIFVINKCISLNWSGDKSSMLKLLDSIDWSSADSKFRLAVLVLRGDFKKAESIMSAMNGEDPITEHDFRTWPLFRDFRKSENFKRAFKKIYKKEYMLELPEIESTIENSEIILSG